MKSILKYLFGIVLCSFLIACEGFLDEKPDSTLVIPSTLDDFQALLDAEPRSMNATAKLGLLASDEILMSNVLVNQSTLEERGAYFWEKNIYPPDDPGVDWAFSYGKIFYANVVLEGLRDFKPSTAEEERRAKLLEASARFYRASGHFSVAQIFAPILDPANPNQLGVPIRKDADINASSPRVSLEEVYMFILEDLEISRGILPELPDIPTRPSRWAVEALLSRIHLSIQNYEKAYQHATNALDIKNELLDYNSLDPSLRFGFERFNVEIIHFSRMYSGRFTSSNQLLVNPEVYNLYDSTDLRKTILFGPSPIEGMYFLKGKYTANLNFFTGLATDEVILDRAESAARLGMEEVALSDLNFLLQNRYKTGTYSPIVDLSGDELLTKIIDERRKELVFRGIRWLDLRRLNLDPSRAVTINRIWNGSEAVLTPNSEGYVFPIPPREINLNELL